MKLSGRKQYLIAPEGHFFDITMMRDTQLKTDVVIVGGGLAGMVTALELLDHGKHVVLVDREKEENFGGLAKESFGGVFFVDSPVQRRTGIKDSTEIALNDWTSFAEFGEQDVWPKRWAEYFINHCTSDAYYWLRKKGIRFFPIVHWVERGFEVPGNSVPRFHMIWGTGYELIARLANQLSNHPHRDNLTLLFNHRVTDLDVAGGKVQGITGVNEVDQAPFIIRSEQVVIASGGISGNFEMMKEYWYHEWSEFPSNMLNGSHHFATGDLHRLAEEKACANLTHLDLLWPYAAGIHHHRPKRPNHGLSVIPPKSALWLDADGIRFMPPLISGYDTRKLVTRVSQTPKQYTWQVMNYRIAVKELAISGSEFNPSMREKKKMAFLKDVLLGNKSLVNELLAENQDVVSANSVEELAEKMNDLNGDQAIDARQLEETITRFDVETRKGKDATDDQIKRIASLRTYRGDRARTCKFQPILDPKAMPLMAIREFMVSRKTLGGIQTDLSCRVLGKNSVPVDGLLAVGEASGFGGGGVHGKRSLEGTFLIGCILTGRSAAKTILDH